MKKTITTTFLLIILFSSPAFSEDQYYCIGYENYGDASDPFIYDIEWANVYSGDPYIPDIDYLFSTQIFGRDVMAQVSEKALQDMARSYFFSHISDFEFSGTENIGGIDFTFQGNFIDLNFEITADDKIEVDLSFYMRASSEMSIVTAKGSGALTGDVILETDSANVPQSIIIDPPTVTISGVTVTVFGMVTDVDKADLESGIESYLASYISGLDIPLADSLAFFNNFPNQNLYGAEAESSKVKIVHDTYVSGDEPFVMVGMNIFSGEASEIEDTVFDNFSHNIISDKDSSPEDPDGVPDSFPGDNAEANVIVAITPGTFNALISNFAEAYFPYSTSSVTIHSFEPNFLADDYEDHDFWDDYDCMNLISCTDYHGGECASTGNTNIIGMEGSATVKDVDILVDHIDVDIGYGGLMYFDISKNEDTEYYYLEASTTFTEIDVPWWVDFVETLFEFVTLGFVDLYELTLDVEDPEVYATDEAGSFPIFHLNFKIQDFTVSFHTFRHNQYVMWSTSDEDGFWVNTNDYVFAGFVSEPDLSSYTNDDDGDGLVNVVESEIFLTDSNDADTDNDGIEDGSEVENGLDPVDDTDATEDADSDGLINLEEILTYKTISFNSDTDSDGLTDFEEVNTSCLNALDASDGETGDGDGDGFSNAEEIRTYSTNPCDDDSDDDELNDGEEVTVYGTDPADSDTDDDALTDGEEVNTYTTDPLKKDTDNDSWSDGEEVNATVSKNPLVFDNLISPSVGHDFNGDGYSDLLAFGPDGNYCVIQSTGSRFSHKGEWIKSLGDSTSIPIIGDFNGDGLDDVASFKTDGTITVGLSDGSKFTDDGSYTITGLTTYNQMELLTGDFNGDGKDDLGVITTDSLQILTTGTKTFTYTNTLTVTGYESILSADYNGDGEDDIAVISEGTISISLSASSDLEEWLEDFTNPASQAFTGDFNGDGLADIWVYNSESESIELATSWGDLFMDEGEIATDVSSDYTEILTGDFTGDGYVDFTGYTASKYWRTSPTEMYQGTSHVFTDTGRWKMQGGFEKINKCQGAPFSINLPGLPRFPAMGY